MITVELPLAQYGTTVKIYNMHGAILATSDSYDNVFQIALDQIPAGMYALEAVRGNERYNAIVVKQ